MKKFLAIFGICFGSLVVFLGGFLGVKYLIGDFNPVIIQPDSIKFEQTDYYFDYDMALGDSDENKYYITINGFMNDDEDGTKAKTITEKKVELTLVSNNPKESTDKKSWKDGVIEIPKVATIGEPFEVKLCFTDEYKDEVDNGALNSWIKGGKSVIKATSKNLIDKPQYANVFVDTPTLKTELVIFNENTKDKISLNKAEENLQSGLVNLENSSFATVVPNAFEEGATFPNINEGQTFYVGLKYYPQASTYKYHKLSSTNALIEYKADLDKLITELTQNENSNEEDVNFVVSQIALLNEYCASSEEKDAKSIISVIKSLTTKEFTNSSLKTFFEEKLDEFNSFLKFNLIQNLSNVAVSEGVRVAGTNIFEFVALQDLQAHPFASDFLTYTYKNASKEINAKLDKQEDIFKKLDQDFTIGNVVRNTNRLNIIDVEVDTISISGKVSNINTDSYHTIYASDMGQNSKNSSYLRVDLKNLTTGVDLTHKTVNVGIRFEKKSDDPTKPWISANDDIKFDDSTKYEKIEVTEGGVSLKYYKPYGFANYWKIYADGFVEGEYRVVVKYFIETGEEENPYEIITTEEKHYPIFTVVRVTDANENMISWIDTSVVDLKSVNITSAYLGDSASSFNDQYDLYKNVNKDQLESNVYKTLRYFVYSNDGEDLTKSFDVEQGVKYTLKDGKTYTLFELKNGSSILKLKDGGIIPNTVYAIFVTIRTDVSKNPVYVYEDINNTPQDSSDDVKKYEIIKYSAYKDTVLENVSSLKFTFTKSLSGLSGVLTVNEGKELNAGVIPVEQEDGKFIPTLKVGKNMKDLLRVSVSCTDNEDLFKRAIESGEIRIVGKTTYNGETDYINFEPSVYGEGSMAYLVSTKDISNETIISIYIEYTVAGKKYYFEVPYTHKEEGKPDVVLKTLTIVSDIASSAEFAFVDAKGDVILEEISHIEISTILNENKLSKIYNLYIKDKVSPTEILEDNIFETTPSGEVQIRKYIKNFLGKQDTLAGWKLESSDTSVAQIVNNKTIVFVDDGTVTISLYLEGNDQVQDTITFIVKDSGYVNAYAYNDLNGNNIQIFTQNGESYTEANVNLTIIGDGVGQIILKNTEETEPEKNTALFAMWYTLDKPVKLNDFKVTLTDEDSINTYKAITGNEYDATIGITNFNYKKLGEAVVLNMLYSFEGMGLTARVRLGLTQVISVNEFKVFDDQTEIEPISNIGDEQYTYDLYAGKKYNFETTFNGLETQANATYYLRKEDGSYIKMMQSDELSKLGIEIVDDKIVFTDKCANDSYDICVSNISTNLQIGDLQHIIVVNVKPNIAPSTEIKNNGFTKNITLENNGIGEILLSELFVRENSDNSEPLNVELFDFYTLTNISSTDALKQVYIDGDKLVFNFTRGGVVNELNCSIRMEYHEELLNAISFTIYPHNFENEKIAGQDVDYRVVKYNQEKAIILVNGDVVDEYFVPTNITSYFDNVNLDYVSMDDISEYVDGGKITATTRYLLTDTQKYLSMNDPFGNRIKYRVIISQLAFPFVNIQSHDDNYNLANLDIYSLFVEQDEQKLKQYYIDNALYVGSQDFFGGHEISGLINLLTEDPQTGINDSLDAIYYINDNGTTIYDGAKLNITYSFVESELYENDYIVLKESSYPIEIETKLIGQETYLCVKVKYQKSSSVYYEIPTIIKINPSQMLEVKYPFDDRNSESIDKEYFEKDDISGNENNRGYYGSEAYDAKYMTETTVAFGNGAMEYVSIDVLGKAELELSNDKFVVKNWNGSEFVNYDYNKGYYFEVVSVYANVENVWSKVTNINNLGYFAKIVNENVLQIELHDCVSIRVKVEVTTLFGGSKNYYYVQAGGITDVRLYKNMGTETRANYEEVITVKQGDIIVIGKETSLNESSVIAKFYLKENAENLTFTVSGNTDLYSKSEDGKEITILLSPNNKSFTIDIFTVYGMLSTVTVNVSATYKASLKTNDETPITLYSGFKTSINQIIDIIDLTKPQDDNNVVGYTLLPLIDDIKPVGYDVVETSEGSGEYEVRFIHSKNGYTIENFVVLVQIAGKTFMVEIPNVAVDAGITTEYATNAYKLDANTDEDDGITSFVESDGKVNIPQEVWAELFTINSNYSIAYNVVYNGKNVFEQNQTSVSDIQVMVGTITTNITMNLQFQVIATNTNSDTITFNAKLQLYVDPTFKVTPNYSQGINSSFNLEYIQYGANINFKGNNFNEQKRIDVIDLQSGTAYNSYKLVLKTSDGTVISDDCTSYTFNGDGQNGNYGKGDYYVEVVINDAVYGIYNFTVGENPISISDSSLNGQTFYAGYGDDNILNYIDIIVTLPQSLEVKENTTVSIISKVNGEGDSVQEFVIMEDIYYVSSSQKVRACVPLEMFNSGITATNIYVRYTKADNTTADILVSCTINPRYTLKYMQYPVDYIYYKNIINLESSKQDITEEGTKNVKEYKLTLEYNTDLGNVVASEETSKEYYYNVICDIKSNKQIKEKITVETVETVEGKETKVSTEYEINYILNANEYPEGLSFVGMFEIKDYLGNRFTYNNVGDHTINSNEYSKSLNLSYVKIVAVDGKTDLTNTVAPIWLEPQRYGNLVYDYYLNAMGATNSGTIVKLEFVYKVEDYEYSEEICIKVVSDIIHSTLNGDGYSTPNSLNNPYIINVNADVLLADATQTTTNNNLYFIYAYGKYDKTCKNVAQSFSFEQITPYEQYGDVSKKGSSNLYFEYLKRPEFGDKDITIKFTDNFGFTFNYYIKMVSNLRITNININQDSFFEGDIFYVYNKNGTTIPSRGEGVSIELINNSSGDVDGAGIKIVEIKVSASNSGISNNFNKKVVNNNSININYQTQDFWNLTENGRSVVLNLQIIIMKSDSSDDKDANGNYISETYVLNMTIAVYKKYDVSIKEENTYIRDGVEFQVEHLVSVKDNQKNKYLGEPVLEDAQALRFTPILADSFKVTAENVIVEYATDANAILSLTNDVDVFELMKARVNSVYDDVGTFKITYINAENGETVVVDDWDSTIADIVLKQFNIKYDDATKKFTQYLTVKAKHIKSQTSIMSRENAFGVELQIITDEQGKEIIQLVKSSTLIYLGKHGSNIFGTTEVNKDDFDFDVVYNDSINYKEDLIIFTTVEENKPDTSVGYNTIFNVKEQTAMLEKVNVKILIVYSNASSKVLIKVGDNTELTQITIAKGENTIQLDQFIGSEIELFTGLYTETKHIDGSGYTYSLTTEKKAEGNLICFNGLTYDDVKAMKNLKEISLSDGDSSGDGESSDDVGTGTIMQNSQIVYLSNQKAFALDRERNVLYQDILVTVSYTLSTADDKFNENETMRVTLKYTGVDKSDAYTTTADIHFVEIDINSITGEITPKSGYSMNPGASVDTNKDNNNGDYLIKGPAHFALKDWAGAFKIIPGIGRTAELAKYLEAGELSLDKGTVDKMISYELKAVTSTDNNVVNELVEISDYNETYIEQSHNLKLLNGFNLSKYYITINVYCNYPHNNVSNRELIDTIIIGFKLNVV